MEKVFTGKGGAKPLRMLSMLNSCESHQVISCFSLAGEMSGEMMKMLTGMHLPKRPGRTSVTNISPSAASAPGCSHSRFL